MNSNKVSLIVTSSIIDVIFDGELPNEVFQQIKEQLEVTTYKQIYPTTEVRRAVVEDNGVIVISRNRIRITFEEKYKAKNMFIDVVKILEDKDFTI